MKTAYLYELKLPGGKRYIGQTVNFENRLGEHFACARSGRLLPLYSAIRKHGANKVKSRILCVGDLDYILELEKRAIVRYGCRVPSGYNITFGGDSAPSSSPEVARKISRSLRKSPKFKAAMDKTSGIPKSNAHKAAMRGIPKSDEHRKKISKALRESAKAKEFHDRRRGIPNSPIHCERIRQARIGKAIPQEVRDRISAALYGRPLSAAHRKKISRGLLRRQK